MSEQAYLIGLLLAALVFVCVLFLRISRAGENRIFLISACALSAVFAFCLSRGNVYLFGGFMTRRRGFFSLNPYDYSAIGTLLGVFLGILAAARLHGRKCLRMLDLSTPAVLAALAVARFAEFMTDFGWGALIFDPRFQFFPLCVTDMYKQYHLAVFLFEGLAALAILFMMPRKPAAEGAPFVVSAARFMLSQIFFESLRAETLRVGFVRIHQVECAVLLLVMVICILFRDRRSFAVSAGVLLGTIGIAGLSEYALDKITIIPAPVVYLLMCTALIVCGHVLRKHFVPALERAGQ